VKILAIRCAKLLDVGAARDEGQSDTGEVREMGE